MFSKTVFAVAAAGFVGTAMAGGVDQCNTGTQVCCNSLQKADSPQAAKILGSLVGVVVDAAAEVALGCSPITVIGIAGNSCSEKPLCCNSFHADAAVGLGCDPIDLLD